MSLLRIRKLWPSRKKGLLAMAGVSLAAIFLVAAEVPPGPQTRVAAMPAKAPRTLGFVVSYFYLATSQDKDACPQGEEPKPPHDKVLAQLSPEERTRLLKPENYGEWSRKMLARGPKGEDVCQIPTAVADPGLRTLAGARNPGLNLDGNDGKGPAGGCPQKNFVSETGEPGVDNQLGRTWACLHGLKENGSLMGEWVNDMRAGAWSILIEVTDVDDLRNDPHVVVNVYGGADPMAVDPKGKVISGASLQPVADKKLHTVLSGRIVNGVLETDPVGAMTIPYWLGKRFPPLRLTSARMRLELTPNGGAKGMLGGYTDWRPIFTSRAGIGAIGEDQMGFSCPGLYYAMAKLADGDRDPATGLCNAMSAAFRVEAVPAYIIHPETVKPAAFADARP